MSSDDDKNESDALDECDSSSSSDEVVLSEEDLKSIMNIEAKLEANSMDYDAHIQASGRLLHASIPIL